MIRTWLAVDERDPSQYSKFELHDVVEASPPTEECVDYLARSVTATRYPAEFLAALAQELGWADVREIVLSQVPGQPTARSGEFGEVLSGALLEHFHGYVIPVRKLRFKITKGQQLPATDILSLRLDKGGDVSEVCYSESKLRTGPDLGAALEGCSQLEDAVTKKMPDILLFVLTRLFEHGSPLYGTLTTYLRDRRDRSSANRCRLFLCYDRTAWDERALQNVEDANPQAPNLAIHAVRIEGLQRLIVDVFSRIGAVRVLEGD